MRFIAILEPGSDVIHYVRPESIDRITDCVKHREVQVGHRHLITKQTYAELLEAIDASQKPQAGPWSSEMQTSWQPALTWPATWTYDVDAGPDTMEAVRSTADEL